MDALVGKCAKRYRVVWLFANGVAKGHPDSAALRSAFAGRRPNAAALFATAALHSDLVFLRRLLRRLYAGYPDLLHHRQFNVEGFFEAWLDRVHQAGDQISFHEGVIEPLTAIRLAVLDRHFIIWGAEAILDADPRLAVHEYQAVLPGATVQPDSWSASDVNGAHPPTLRVAPLLRPTGEIASVLTLSASSPEPVFHLPLGETILLLARRPDVVESALQSSTHPAYAWSIVEDTSLIRLRSFAGRPDVTAQLRRFVADYPQHARQPRVLIDLRGNHGGTLQFLQQWIAQARRGTWWSYPRLDVGGALWPCSEWNVLVEAQIRQGTVDTAEARAERDRGRATWSDQTPPPPSRLDTGLREGRADTPYAGQVFVLLDRHAGSSGELAALELQRALGAVLIGERSAGALQYGEVRRLVLPATGLVCQLPTRRFFFDTEVEGVGLPVVFYLEQMDQEAAALIPSLERIRQVMST